MQDGNQKNFTELLNEFFNTNRIKKEQAAEIISKLRNLMPTQLNPYKPTGKFEPRKLPIFILGMILIGLLQIPIFQFYIGYIQGYLISSGSQLRGADYGMYVGNTFYIIAGILIINIILSFFGARNLAKLSLCRNKKILLAGSSLPSLVIILYLYVFAIALFHNEAYPTFIFWLSILVFVSSLAVLLFLDIGSLPIFDEQCGKYLKKYKSPRLNITMAYDFLCAVQEKNDVKSQMILKNSLKKLKENDKKHYRLSYFQLYLRKLPAEYEYKNGYLEGRLTIRGTRMGNNKLEEWTFIFQKMEKPLIENLYNKLNNDQ